MAGEETPCPEIFFVSEKKMQVLKHMLKKKRAISKELLGELVEPAKDAAETEMMVPIDMTGFGDHEYEDIDSAVAKLGAKATAEAFVKSEELFEKFKQSVPEGPDRDMIPQPMTIREWREALEEDEEGEDEATTAPEEPPAAKKAKVE
eukprot:TRINITY_DN84732_c0_g1_i1.p2 TRINITY_DN84732_c0_g1~~TRINITY_DN84732_c0_g1_i1.p2  ORF type:complete len:148 (-),score=55.97 TRINITY_DN84732_c0_g1_i1:15-458(-)